jgi:hypothetical protein
MIAKSMLVILACFALPTLVQAFTQAHLAQTILPAPTVTTVLTPEGKSLAATEVALTVNVVASSGVIVPNGTVLLSEGPTAMDSVPLINGTAHLIENFSSVGGHQLTACSIGTANFLPSCSAPIDLTILAPYVLEQSESSGLITTSATFTDRLNIIPAKGFAGTVQLSCQTQEGRCNLSTTSLSFSGNSEPQIVKASFTPPPPVSSTVSLLAPLLGIVGYRNRRRRLATIVLGIIASAAFLCGLTGCHALSYPFVAASDSMTISATSGSYNQTVSYQITVNP